MLPDLGTPQHLENFLSGILLRALPATRVRCFHCDSGIGGTTEALGGLIRAQLLLAAREKGEPCPVIVLFGLQLRVSVENQIPVEETGLRLLWHWPGLAYLSYGFDEKELVDAALRASAGALVPPPLYLLPSASKLLQLISDIRHWLENRRRNVEGARRDFESALKGKFVLDDSYCTPVSAISDAHRQMLERLWSMETTARLFAPNCGGLSGIRAAVGDFEICWRELESARSALRQSGTDSEKVKLSAACDAHRSVSDALTVAILRINSIEHEVIEKAEA